MSSSPSASQRAQKRSRDDDDSTGSKRPHLLLSQVSEATDDKRIADGHARTDGATMELLVQMEWDPDTIDTSLKNQQLEADILHAVRRTHDLYKLRVHPDWAVNPNASPEERVAFLEKAIYIRPRVSEALLDAFKDGKFKTIRNAAFFRRPYVGPQASKPMENTEVTERAVRDAWRTPYMTDDPSFLYDLVNNMKQKKWADNQNSDDYSNTVAMVQSSGTGKSRMVDETSRFVFTFPFNLRSDQESETMAYPLPDPTVRDYMLATDNKDRARKRYHIFFQCLFRLTKEELEALYQGPKISQEELASIWREHLENKGARDGFYGRVIEAASVLLLESTFTTIDVIKNTTIQEITQFIFTLDSVVDNLTASVKVLLYFDEAHPLTSTKCLGSMDALYPLLLSVLSDYVRCALFVVFISTTSHVGHFAPPLEATRSIRATECGAHQAPITGTPFDCAPNIRVEQNTYTRQDVAGVRFMSRFGRPLFWTFFSQIKDEDMDRSIRSFLGVLRSKLLYKMNYEKPLRECSELGRLAVVDVRLCLQYEPHVEGNRAMDTQARLVASHMRLAYAVPTHRQYFRSGYPSEPILAEAAAQQLHHWRGKNRTAFLDILLEHMQSGLLDRGERGEVVARMLVTEAYDRAVAENATDQQSLLFSFGCRVVNFIRKLFSAARAEAILKSKPANCDGKTFEAVFGDAWIRFTHFAQSADDHTLNTHSMFAAFSRGMAYTCRNGESFIDFITPILLWDAKLSSWVMSAIFWQVKRRVRAGNYEIDAESLGFFHPEPADRFPEGDNRPYITIVMDLGVQSPIPTYAQPASRKVSQKSQTADGLKDLPQVSAISPQTSAPPASPSKFKVSSRPENLRPPSGVVHPRYAIYVSGCSSTNYGVIGESDWELYRQLLRTNDFLYEHPRPETIPKVMAQKPVFALGSNSYSWVDSDVLNPKDLAAAYDDNDDETFLISEYDRADSPM